MFNSSHCSNTPVSNCVIAVKQVKLGNICFKIEVQKNLQKKKKKNELVPYLGDSVTFSTESVLNRWIFMFTR